jgi:hypothetical protein
MPNNGSGFFPNVTVTSVATPYNRLAAELQCLINFNRSTLTLTLTDQL